jgi:hypothetical protein
MNDHELNKLTFRRGLIIENIEALNERARTAMNTLDEIRTRITGLENALAFVNTVLMNHFNNGSLPKVEVIKVLDEREKEKIMLRIEIGSSGKSIYKILHNLDLALYANDNTVIDKMGFMYQCQELACEYLKNNQNIASAIDDMEDYLSDVLPRFIESPRIEEQLLHNLSRRRRRF